MPDILSPSTSIFGELNFTLGSGTITAGNRQIVPTSSGLSLNVPDTKGIYGSINDVNFLALTPSSFWLGDLATGATVSYIYGTGSGLTLNTATGNTFSFTINGSNNAVFSSSLATLSATNGIYFPSTTGSVTGANRSIVPTAAGLQLNVPTGKYIVGSVNGTEVFHAETATSSGYVQLGNPASGAIFYADAGGSFISTPSGSTQDSIINAVSVLSLSSSLATMRVTDGIYLTSSTGTITGSRRQISGTSTGMTYNTPSATSHIHTINNTAISTLSTTLLTLAQTNGITFTSATGTFSGDSRSLTGSSEGMSYNTTTNLGHVFREGNSIRATISGAGLFFTNPLTLTNSNPTVIYTSGGMVVNAPSGTNVSLKVNGSNAATFDTTNTVIASTNGVNFTASTGTVSSTLRHIVPTSTGINFNVPTGTNHIFSVNGVSQAAIDATGLTFANNHTAQAPSVYGIYRTANVINIQMPSGGSALRMYILGTRYMWIGEASAGGGTQVAIGYNAGLKFSSTNNLIAIGSSTLNNGATNPGSEQMAIGSGALSAAATGSGNNIAIGVNCANAATTLSGNTLVGNSILQAGVCTGTNNSVFGGSGFYYATSASNNCVFGYAAVRNGVFTGSQNVVIGTSAAYNCTGINYAVSIGHQSMGSAVGTGTGSVCVGYRSGYALTSGNYNVLIGWDLSTITSGSSNIVIGNGITVGSITGDNQINIGGAFQRDTSGNVTLKHGTTGSTLIATTSSSAFTLAVAPVIPTNTPATSGATGTTGQIAWDASYIYVCTATNTWKRAAIATW